LRPGSDQFQDFAVGLSVPERFAKGAAESHLLIGSGRRLFGIGLGPGRDGVAVHKVVAVTPWLALPSLDHAGFGKKLVGFRARVEGVKVDDDRCMPI
jgi:hypothetical protein